MKALCRRGVASAAESPPSFGLRCQGGDFGVDHYGSVEGKNICDGVVDLIFSGLFFLLPMGQTASSLQIQVSYQGQLKFDCVSAAKTGHIEEHDTFAYSHHCLVGDDWGHLVWAACFGW